MALKRPLATAMAIICTAGVLCGLLALIVARGLLAHLVDTVALLVDLFCVWYWLVRRAEAN